MPTTATTSHIEMVTDMYEYFHERDFESVLSNLTDDIEWTSPFGTARGKDELLETNWQPFVELLEAQDVDWLFVGETFVEDGDDLAVFGHGILTTDDGDRTEVPIAHHWVFDDGKVSRFQVYPDTAMLNELLDLENVR